METQVECLRLEGRRAVVQPEGPVARVSAKAVPALRGVEILVIPPDVDAFYGLNRFENLRLVEYGGTGDVFAFQDSLDWLSEKLADEEGSLALPICAKLEADIAELDDPDEKAMFMEELGLKQSGLDRLIQASYELLGLISFLTAGSDECRAWTIKKGTRAPQAAGKIHSDFERGFIRAEVIAFDDLKACGTMAAAKAKGLVRSEGKEYVMKDGDIVNFLFNV